MSLYVIEFSLSQRCFHKQTLESMLLRNVENILKRVQTDYIPVGVFDTEEKADIHIKGFEGMKEYSMYKNMNGEMVVIKS